MAASQKYPSAAEPTRARTTAARAFSSSVSTGASNGPISRVTGSGVHSAKRLPISCSSARSQCHALGPNAFLGGQGRRGRRGRIQERDAEEVGQLAADPSYLVRIRGLGNSPPRQRPGTAPRQAEVGEDQV